MVSVLDVANYIVAKYREIANKAIDELKLQKLLYLSQRESIAITGEPMFKENMYGWRYGPVCKEVRRCYTESKGISTETKDIPLEVKYILNNVIHQYGQYEPWKLVEMTHMDYSWRKSREGLSPDENGDRVIEIEDIRKDAEKVRPYDSVWDMYYDEFEDCSVS